MNTTPKRITRNRPTTACTECRKRRLKCDRTQPCGTCVRRADAASCEYYVGRSKSQAEARLDHLEGLIRQLSKQTVQQHRVNGNTKQVAAQQAPGTANKADDVVNHEAIYNGPTHWTAILDDIKVLRDVITPSDNSCHGEVKGTDIIFGVSPSLPYEAVLEQYLPPRKDVDRLVAAYFRSKATMVPFIHTNQFARLFRKFWESPLCASPLWVSMLFSMMNVATNLLCSPGEGDKLNIQFSVAAAHCLVSGRYHRPKAFAIEALILYLQAGCLTNLEHAYDVGSLFALALRLAYRQGYHGEPEVLKLSPFAQEMRRRTWTIAMQLDLLVSFQLGVPSNVQPGTWDIRPPSNLMDSDFDEDSVGLPLERPNTVATDVLFWIAKHNLMTVFGKILWHTLNAASSGEELLVLALDQELREVYAATPEILRPRTMADSVVDPSSMIVARLCTVFIYDKSLCVLHRSYAAKGVAGSVQVCYNAATDLLSWFSDAYVDFRVGGAHESERWFMSSITWNDFLLASMVLCLVLCAIDQYAALNDIDHEMTLRLLYRSLSAANDHASKSGDTMRVKKVLEATIARFGKRLSSGRMCYPAPFSPLANGNDVPIDQMSAAEGPTVDFGQMIGWQWSENLGQFRDDPSWTYLDRYLHLVDPGTG